MTESATEMTRRVFADWRNALPQTQSAIPARALYPPKETEVLLSVSHAQLYRLINAGRLDARKIGNRTLITADSIEAFIAALPRV